MNAQYQSCAFGRLFLPFDFEAFEEIAVQLLLVALLLLGVGASPYEPMHRRSEFEWVVKN